MKNIIIILTMVLFSSGFIYTQDGRRYHKGSGEKMKDLEKIKLIEALDMDEETTLKFFSRRNMHMEKMEGLREKEDDQLKRINDIVEKNENPDDPELKKMIDEYFGILKDMNEEKRSFINSLDEILTYRQMAKLVAFEPRFREEIRKILFEKRRPPR